jgi:hypothetical protein
MSKTGISVASKAPSFKLPDQDGREVALSDFVGSPIRCQNPLTSEGCGVVTSGPPLPSPRFP